MGKNKDKLLLMITMFMMVMMTINDANNEVYGEVDLYLQLYWLALIAAFITAANEFRLLKSNARHIN